MALFKKQIFENYGTPPSEINRQDYDDLLATLNAKKKEEREVDPEEAQKKMSAMFGGL